jgi:CBS domain-containing membrane protein
LLLFPRSVARSALFSGTWWRAFLPARTRISGRERLRLSIGALLGILLTALASHMGGGYSHSVQPWLVAPLGAAAVLVFAVPSSPMAQPWPLVAGNTLSALLGIAAVHAAHLVGAPEVAAALAVAVSIVLMLALRCLHPPGAATALLVVLGGVSDPWFALYPVFLNSVLLVVVGVVYNNLTGRAYPHMQLPANPAGASAGDRDLDAVLRDYNQVLDVSRDDLEALLADLRMRSYQRRLNDVKCTDIMSTDLVTVQEGTPLQEAWTLLRQRRIKALPVVDNTFRIAGIVTLADFLRTADLDVHQGFDTRLKKIFRRGAGPRSGKPEVVGQIMTRQVRVAGMSRSLADLLPLFASTSHHHIPIVGDQQRLVGMVTQSDLVAALGRDADEQRPGVRP